VEVHREALDIDALTRSIFADFDPMMATRGIRRRFEVSAGDRANVLMDRYIYERILFNLLSNAVKFTRPGGEIVVRLVHKGDRLTLSVRDTGIGIGPEDQAKLFRRFQQVEGAATRRFEGVGLGLALVKEFAELLSGTVTLQSRPNEGSVFTVECAAPETTGPAVALVATQWRARAYRGSPSASAPELPAADGAAERADRLDGKVLIVEDNEELARYIAECLRPICEAKVTHDADEAVKLIRDWMPTLVLSDVMMPGRDGLSLCREIKSDPVTRAIPFVLLSALTYRQALLQGWEAGADDYLFKPFHPTELVTRIRTLIVAQQKLAAEREARVAAETALSMTTRQLAEAQRLAHVGSWEWDVASNNIAWSDELYRLFGVERSEFSATYEGYLTHVHPEDRELAERTIREGLDSRGEFAFEHRVIRAGGEIVWVHGRGCVYRDDAGKAVRMAGTAHEITDRKQAEDARLRLVEAQAARHAAEAAREHADRANQTKDDFLATVSHELRTPLNAMLGWTSLLRSGCLSDDKRSHALEVVERNAQTQAQLVDDLLDVTRIISGKLRLDLERVELHRLAVEAMENLRVATSSKNIQIGAAIDPDACTVMGDRGRLQQVVWNLLSNAVKFTPAGGRVDVKLQRVGARAKLVVRDSGKGIAPEFLPRVFERFSQADGSPTRVHGGLGIGLAIAREIIQSHGGEIGVESAGVGKGATFTVWLALVESLPSREAASTMGT
jgi:PAS domain S-box-containing protein